MSAIGATIPASIRIGLEKNAPERCSPRCHIRDPSSLGLTQKLLRTWASLIKLSLDVASAMIMVLNGAGRINDTIMKMTILRNDDTRDRTDEDDGDNAKWAFW